MQSVLQQKLNDVLYDGLTHLKRRGRKPGIKNRIKTNEEEEMKEECEIIVPYGTKTRPLKRRLNTDQPLHRTFFSAQSSDFFMLSYYKQHGSVLLLDQSILELTRQNIDVFKIFQKTFLKVMNCELKDAFENENDTVIEILKKNILLFKEPFYDSNLDSEEDKIFARSVIIVINDLFDEYVKHTCSLCNKTYDFECIKCSHRCNSQICKSCLIDHLNINRENKCIGIGCMSQYELFHLPKIEERKYKERFYAQSISFKRINQGIFICDCGEFKPIIESTNEGFVQCPKCSKILCIACGLSHLVGFCALLINEALSNLNTDEFKPCPYCGTVIQKSQGCLHMKCVNCHKFFCFSCGNYYFFSLRVYIFFRC